MENTLYIKSRCSKMKKTKTKNYPLSAFRHLETSLNQIYIKMHDQEHC